MHLFTLCLLAIFFPQMLVGMQESKSWDEFSAMMKQGGSFLLMSATTPAPNDCTNEIAEYCAQHPNFKCYYMIEALQNEPLNSFNKHFNNNNDIIVFYKDGVQKSLITPVDKHFKIDAINDGFKKAS